MLMLLAPLPADLLVWTVALLAAGSGVALNILLPQDDPELAELLLLATVHP